MSRPLVIAAVLLLAVVALLVTLALLRRHHRPDPLAKLRAEYGALESSIGGSLNPVLSQLATRLMGVPSYLIKDQIDQAEFEAKVTACGFDVAAANQRVNDILTEAKAGTGGWMTPARARDIVLRDLIAGGR